MIMIYLLISMIGVVSFALSKLYLRIAISKSIYDIPNERSSHTIPTPRGGGMAITISFYFGLSILFFMGEIEERLFYALLPGLGLSLIGVIDDFKGLSPLIRLVSQVLCSFMAVILLGRIQLTDGSIIVLGLEYFLSIVGIIWFINLFNFMDGANGYASMEAVFIGISIWLLTGSYEAAMLVFSVLGFLYWNIPKARLFMGDSGSTVLGYIVAILGIYLHNSESLHISYWLVLTSLFWIDASITLSRRILRRESLSKAHKNHYYQRAIISGLSHMGLMFYGLLINILLLIMCYLRSLDIITFVLCIILANAIYGILIVVIERKQKYNVNMDEVN